LSDTNFIETSWLSYHWPVPRSAYTRCTYIF